jgi:hypothetical protein
MNPYEAKQKLIQINQWCENDFNKPEMFVADSTITFDANYGRIGIIWIGKETCIGCGIKKQCLIIDQSEGEYTQCTVCFDCLNILKEATENES